MGEGPPPAPRISPSPPQQHSPVSDYFLDKGALLLHLLGISHTNIFNHL